MKNLLRYLYFQKTMVFYEYPIPRPSEAAPPSSNIKYRALTKSDYGRFDALLSVQRQQETVFKPIFDLNGAIERIDSGEYCFISEDDKDIIGYCWFAPHKKHIREIDATIRLEDHWLYGYNGYVRKDYRGRNIADLMFFESLKELWKGGYTTIIVFRMDWNLSVKRAIEKAGFSYIGQVKVGYFLTFRYMIDRCEKIALVRHSGPFELYRKMWQRLKATK